jgi:hypothetical protein
MTDTATDQTDRPETSGDKTYRRLTITLCAVAMIAIIYSVWSSGRQYRLSNDATITFACDAAGRPHVTVEMLGWTKPGTLHAYTDGTHPFGPPIQFGAGNATYDLGEPPAGSHTVSVDVDQPGADTQSWGAGDLAEACS